MADRRKKSEVWRKITVRLGSTAHFAKKPAPVGCGRRFASGGLSMLSRRKFLLAGASAGVTLLGCRRHVGPVVVPRDAGAGRFDNHEHSGAVRDPVAAAKNCQPTPANIEGPFYKPGAPAKLTLVEGSDPGQRLELAGTVRDQACAPIAGAWIEIWQADHLGAYDNRGFRFRGHLQTGADGGWRISTIVPGRYLNGAQFRPAHIHVKLAARGVAPLTTQLYFPNDPFNDVDPFIHQALLLDVKARGTVVEGGYNFVL